MIACALGLKMPAPNWGDTLINDAFRVDQEGSINTGQFSGLRRLDIQDPKWLAAMRAIGDAVCYLQQGLHPYL